MYQEREWKSYEFANDYKKLPMKKRAGLIRTARNLLRQQKKDAEMFADTSLSQEAVARGGC